MVRVKNRYLLVNILYPVPSSTSTRTISPAAPALPDLISFNQPTTDELKPQQLLKAIRDTVVDIFGDYGAGAVAGSLMIKYLSPATSTFILRVSRAHYRLVWAALSLMNQIPIRNGKECVYRVVRVSGTVRKAEEEAIRRARAIIMRARKEASEKGGVVLEGLFSAEVGEVVRDVRELVRDVDMGVVDGSDEEEEEEEEEAESAED